MEKLFDTLVMLFSSYPFCIMVREPLCIPLCDIPEMELPGLWSRSDFMGGWTDC